jgi:hypothetical protein
MTYRRGALVAWLAVSACAGPNWQPLTLPSPAPLESKTIVEFHAKDSLVRLHGVRSSRDSVTGIPWLDHLTCDTCRVAYALADVSGVRTGNPGAGAWALGAPIFIVTGSGLLLGLLLVLFPIHDN